MDLNESSLQDLLKELDTTAPVQLHHSLRHTLGPGHRLLSVYQYPLPSGSLKLSHPLFPANNQLGLLGQQDVH